MSDNKAENIQYPLLRHFSISKKILNGFHVTFSFFLLKFVDNWQKEIREKLKSSTYWLQKNGND